MKKNLLKEKCLIGQSSKRGRYEMISKQKMKRLEAYNIILTKISKNIKEKEFRLGIFSIFSSSLARDWANYNVLIQIEEGDFAALHRFKKHMYNQNGRPLLYKN
jgi:hypothetical protein